MPAKDQRARARALGVPNAGLGRLKELLKWERKDWAKIEQYAEHVADLQAQFMQGSLSGSTGAMTISLATPVEYAADATEISTAGIAGSLFIRVYVVTPDAFQRVQDQGDGDEEG